MSDQKTNFMSALDAWTDEHILLPMSEVQRAYYETPEAERSGDERFDESLWSIEVLVKKAIREKVLESYHNGRSAQGRGAQQKGRVWKKR